MGAHDRLRAVISTFIVEHRDLVHLALGVALALCLVVAVWAVRAGRTGRRVAGALAVLGVLGIVALTLVPDTRPTPGVTCNLDAAWFWRDRANLALFAPAVLFAAIASRRPLVVLAVAAAGSALVETLQGLTPVLGRRCDVDDWLGNTSGALLAAVVATVLVRALDRRR